MSENNYQTYEKAKEKEHIRVGDLLELEPSSGKVKLAINRFNKKNRQIIRGLYKN